MGSPLEQLAKVDPNLIAALQRDPIGEHAFLLTFEGRIQDLDVTRTASITRVVRTFPDFGVIYAVGSQAALPGLLLIPRLQYVSGNNPLELHMSTAAVATRARDVWDVKSTSTSAVIAGAGILTGEGIGVALIDTGVDATHPDLAGTIVSNLQFVCGSPRLVSTDSGTCYANRLAFSDNGCSDIFWAALPDSDAHGHGTFLAGIIAGRGTMSAGRFPGVAPGASVFSLGAHLGTFDTIYALEALNWVHCHHDTMSPAIRVVSNSWGSRGPFRPSDPINKAVDTLVKSDGLVVLFSVGNQGSWRTENRISQYAKNPTAGVISVGSYSDFEVASRNGSVSEFSSRGSWWDVDRNDWPDVVAPGELITSTASKSSIEHFELDYQPYYTVGGGPVFYLPERSLGVVGVWIGGTSAAAAHVAGIGALLLAARPELTPAGVEDILEDNALQFEPGEGGGYFEDPTNPTSGSNLAAGHGLVDAIASLEDWRVLNQVPLGSAQPQVNPNPHVYERGLAPDLQLVGGAQWTLLADEQYMISERSLESGEITAWPLFQGMPANFRIIGPEGYLSNVPTFVSLDGRDFRMDATVSFDRTGTFTVESQLEFASRMISFDSFELRVVGGPAT